MKRIKQYIITAVLAAVAVSGVSAFALGGVANAIDPSTKVLEGVNAAGGNGGSGSQSLATQIQNAVNVLLFIVGVIAVIMIILGGLRYVLSNGDSSQISSAKNTVLYSVIGLVVALLAYAIVNFVVTQFK